MAKGQKLKQEIMQKILSIFPDSFLYNDGKEIRINGIEDSENLQIKCVLTASKVAVEPGSDNEMPTAKTIAADNKPEIQTEQVPIELSQEEKDNIQNLLKSIGL